MTDPGETASFRLGYVPGATPGKWARIWAERRPDVPLELLGATTDDVVDRIRSGEVDAGVVRLPIDRTGLHAIPLYTETTVVVAPKEHVLTAVDEAVLEDLADEIVLRPRDDTLSWDDAGPGRAAAFEPTTTAEAIELVAAGVGLLVLPQSLARLHHRRDLAHRPVVDAPQSSVVLTWPDADNTELMEEFIGIVRGRTPNSSRTPRRQDRPSPGAPARAKKRPTGRRATRRR
ncbi:LysR family substrate-binding domain-containing protein [Actinomycetospora sp. TBRC 11914]|uniref:LysR family substrate-binding domain-containing protein n=1 Tax=Actinomycetospora sp. TBRC 11914 TaxID=2729387 RepID=UPI00145F43DA|nr:LysR family substrate-binding domain-containing protein [Actinomycetospora sp. TBRC 11914]NMO88248.1 LysR family substrate-binding domain-containing protein [Actinomycetospora sp. TBRC 11914]